MPILAVSMLNAEIPWVHTDVYAKSDSVETDTPATVRNHNNNKKKKKKKKKEFFINHDNNNKKKKKK